MYKYFQKVSLLLPYYFQPVGLILILPGAFFLILRFYYEIKPTILDIKFFAFYSTYLGSKYFTVIENHFTEELGGALLFLGLAFVALSKEKDEKPVYNDIRLKAFLVTFIAMYFYLFLAILFVYGLAFIKIILLGLVIQSLIYIVVLKYFLYLFRKNTLSLSNEEK